MAMFVLLLCFLAAAHTSVNGEPFNETMKFKRSLFDIPTEEELRKYVEHPDARKLTHLVVTAAHPSVENVLIAEGITVSNKYIFSDVTILIVEINDQAHKIRTIDWVQSVEEDTLQSPMQCESQDLSKTDGLWNLARTNWRNIKHYTKNFYFDRPDGEDTTVYLVDIGVYGEHYDFRGRVTHGYTVPSLENEGDDNGHGTHCAGTILGTIFGAAKSAKMVSVKVLEKHGWGRPSECIGGLNWILNDYKKKAAENGGNYQAVVSIPLTYRYSKAINEVIKEMHKAGLLTITAAGNSLKNACFYSPASSPFSITVTASNKNDKLAWFSNHGGCVDIIAPGVDILSADIQSKSSVLKRSGTSMASCLVTGAVLRFLSQTHRNQPDDIRKWLSETSTKDVIAYTGRDHGTPNHFLYQPCIL